MYYVYILQSEKDSRFYTGLTNDLSRRLGKHNSGQMHSTKAHAPFKLMYCEEYETRVEAREREKFFKTGAGRELRSIILETNNIPR